MININNAGAAGRRGRTHSVGAVLITFVRNIIYNIFNHIDVSSSSAKLTSSKRHENRPRLAENKNIYKLDI